MPNSLRNIILVLTLVFTGLFFWLWPQLDSIVANFEMPDFNDYEYDDYEYDYEYDSEDYGFGNEFYYNELYGQTFEKWKEDFATVSPQLGNVSLVCLPESGYYCIDECLDTGVSELLIIETYPVYSTTNVFTCLIDDCSEEIYTPNYYDGTEYLEYSDGSKIKSININSYDNSYSESIYENDYSAGTYYYGQCYSPAELSAAQQQEIL
jgi:hypothetical protein